MDCSMKCIKYLLFAFNLLFAISGLALIITGGVIQGNYSRYLNFLGDKFFNTPVLLVIVGCIIFFVTFFGCCGAVKENHCMIMTFSVLLALIFLVELGAGIAAYMLRGQVSTIVSTNMEKGLMNYGKPHYKGVTETWNILQHELKCCGANDYEDWSNTTFSSTSGNVPDSCCLSDVVGCGNGVLLKDNTEAAKVIHVEGCLPKFIELIKKNVASVGAIGVCVALIQIVGIVFACCLAHNIKSQYETV